MLSQWRLSHGGELPQGHSLSTSGSSGGNSRDRGAQEPLDRRKVIADIKEQALGMGEKPDYVTVKGCLTYIKHDNDPW